MNDISEITDQLYVSSYLDDRSVEKLEEMNFGLVISMIGRTFSSGKFTKTDCKVLSIRAHDNFLLPISMRSLIRGVEQAVPVIESGGKVLVYCREGKRRSVAMASCILIATGFSIDDATALIKQMRSLADPTRWYIHRRIRKFEHLWKRLKSK